MTAGIGSSPPATSIYMTLHIIWRNSDSKIKRLICVTLQWLNVSFVQNFHITLLKIPLKPLQVCVYVCYLAKFIVRPQVLFVFTAGFGTQQHNVAMVFCFRHIDISSLQLVVEGGRCEVQWVTADVLVAGCDEVHCDINTSLQVWKWEKGLQQLQNKTRKSREKLVKCGSCGNQSSCHHLISSSVWTLVNGLDQWFPTGLASGPTIICYRRAATQENF